MYIIATVTRALDFSHMDEAYAAQFDGATRIEALVARAKHETSEDICAFVESEMEGQTFRHIWSTVGGAAVVEIFRF